MNEANNATTLHFADDVDSCSSTPFVSAPSSPGRDIPISTGFYFSAPSSPMHYILSTSCSHKAYSTSDASFEFDLPSSGAASADELFFNGQIRPMKLSTHLQRPQILDPLFEEENIEHECNSYRGREIKLRAGSLRRRTRSMSPLRTFEQEDDDLKVENVEVVNVDDVEEEECKTTPRSSSAGRNSSSKRWVFLKEFLYRSKSEGRNHDGQNKFWAFSPSSSKDNKDKFSVKGNKKKDKENISSSKNEEVKRKRMNGNRVGKRNLAPSAHEMHYTAKRAQAEEMRKRTFLPYRQGLLGCLGFSSKSFGAMNGFAKVLNPTVSSTSS